MRFLALLFLVGVTGLGWVAVRLRLGQLRDLSRSTDLFAARFKEFCGRQAGERDPQLYDWLNRKVLEVQKTVNEAASTSVYRDLLREDSGRGGRVLIDALEQMGQGQMSESRLVSLQNYLTRAQCVLDESVRAAERRSRNPVLLFRAGMRSLVVLPALAARWAKGQPASLLYSEDGPRLTVWVTRATLLGLVLPLAILILGWSPFVTGWQWLAARVGDLAETASALVSDTLP